MTCAKPLSPEFGVLESVYYLKVPNMDCAKLEGCYGPIHELGTGHYQKIHYQPNIGPLAIGFPCSKFSGINSI